jgi:hypothetical protein
MQKASRRAKSKPDLDVFPPDETHLSAPETKAGRLQRASLELLRVHKCQGEWV